MFSCATSLKPESTNKMQLTTPWASPPPISGAESAAPLSGDDDGEEEEDEDEDEDGARDEIDLWLGLSDARVRRTHRW